MFLWFFFNVDVDKTALDEQSKSILTSQSIKDYVNDRKNFPFSVVQNATAGNNNDGNDNENEAEDEDDDDSTGGGNDNGGSQVAARSTQQVHIVLMTKIYPKIYPTHKKDVKAAIRAAISKELVAGEGLTDWIGHQIENTNEIVETMKKTLSASMEAIVLVVLEARINKIKQGRQRSSGRKTGTKNLNENDNIIFYKKAMEAIRSNRECNEDDDGWYSGVIMMLQQTYQDARESSGNDDDNDNATSTQDQQEDSQDYLSNTYLRDSGVETMVLV